MSSFPLNGAELWPLALALGGVFNIVGLLTVPFCPESPRHLAITEEADEQAERGKRNCGIHVPQYSQIYKLELSSTFKRLFDKI